MAKGGGGRSGGSRGGGFKSHSHSHTRSHGHSHIGHGHSHIGHGHSHFGHHHHHGRGRSMRNQGKIFQTQMDNISKSTTAPTLMNGILTVQGSQISVINHMNIRIASPDAIMYQPQPMMYPMPDPFQDPSMAMYQPPTGYPQQVQMVNMIQPPPVIVQQPYVTEANITVVGNKTAEGDTCIFMLIILLAAFLIFPMFFLCCMCTKQLTYPRYDLSVDFYRLVGTFIRKETQCRVLKLTVVDNVFNTEKVRALYQSLQGTQLTGLTFVNRALACNYLGTEADDFRNNVAVLKSLPFTSTFTWGEMIV